DDPEEPRRLGRPAAAVALRERAVGLQVRLLEDVLRVVRVREQAVREAAEILVVAPDERLELVPPHPRRPLERNRGRRGQRRELNRFHYPLRRRARAISSLGESGFGSVELFAAPRLPPRPAGDGAGPVHTRRLTACLAR